MIWLILLFTISPCEDVNLVKNTDPFTKVTTVRGTAPSINVAPFERDTPESASPRNSNRLQLNFPPKDFKLYVSRVNDDLYLAINQTIRYERSHRGENVLKPVLGANSRLQLLFDNDEVINIRYTGERNEATDSFDRSPNLHTQTNTFERRWISIEGKFQLSQDDIQLLKNRKLKLLRVEFENSTTDRQFNQENKDYLVKYLRCLEL